MRRGAAAAAAAQSSCFTKTWTYDVFLNFRGPDTRTSFAGHLYNALHKRGIHTFMDDQGLKSGEELTPSLLRAIEESRIAIIIFSKKYASSIYCLVELLHILEFLKKEGRLVWPVFYDVDPSEVRYQKGSYGEALARHEERFKDGKEKVQKWRLALFQAANLSGWQLKLGNEYEYEFIERITEQVSIKINRIPLHVTNYPVGLDSRLQEVNSLLDVGSNNEVHMVGIYGIGGIGKTTLARAVYNWIGDQFDGLCFLSNVREVSNKHGLLHLQETLLAEIVGEKNIKLGNVNKGVSIIKHRLCQKRVLLVLDDVDRLEQLQAIAGRCDWFGCGSRIIITTRDKQLLASHGVERIYAVKELNDEEAEQLFSWNAFGKDEVDSSYLGISKRVALHSSGLPLASEVIGCNFRGKTVDECNSALDEYERTPDTKVLKPLKFTYDGLEANEKEIFLDVACFFKGYKLEHVKVMLLSVRDIRSEYAIRVLFDKSLIKIEYGYLKMHDLIQEMGKEIVRQESPKEPGSCSRLWFWKDILHVLQENTGTDKIEALILDLPQGKKVRWSGKEFKKMKNLRMLIILNASFSKGPKHLPNSLRVLDWKHYPWKFLPSNFHPTNLVILKLTNSNCVLLKPLAKKFENLSSMNFNNCKSLRQVPDLSGAPNLKKLCLDDCSSLTEIHDSVGFLSKLRVLSAERCTNLRTFPRGIRLTSLERLRLSWCSSLQSFPEVLEKLEKTTELSLPGTAIEELPRSICNFPGLQSLDLVECKRLKRLPFSVLKLPKLWILGAKLCREFSCFRKCEGEEGEGEGEGVSSIVSSEIKLLSFSKCNLSDNSLSMCLSCYPNLIYLDLSFNSFTILPACIKECHLLRDLSVEHCKQLRIIEGMPPNLETFKAKNCSSLTSLSSSTLLNQAFHKPGSRQFILPGQNVPEWFHHWSDGESMCFWVRKEFPAIVVYVVVGVLDDKDCTFNLKLSVRINGTDHKFYSDHGLMSTLKIDHIFLCDLERQLPKGELQKLLLKDQWNHVEVLCMNDSWIRLKGGVIKWTGVHLYQQGNNMENILFLKPSSPKRTCHDLDNSNCDLELGCYPSVKKQRVSQDMGVCDSEWETVTKHKGSSEWLSMRPCWQEPSDHVNWDTNSMKSASTSDTIREQDGRALDHLSKGQPDHEVTEFPVPSSIGGELHQTTSFSVLPNTIHGSPRNQIELTSDDVEMEAFYTSLGSDLNITGPSEETMGALETLQDLFSKDFSAFLHPEQYSTMKTTLEYLSNLSADGRVRGEMRSVISELSRKFTRWSRDYDDASRKIELTTVNQLKVDELEGSLQVNKNRFRELNGLENQLCNELVNLEKRKKELEEQTDTIKAQISVSQSAKDTAGKRKREIYKEAKMLSAERYEWRQQVLCLRDEQESEKKRQAKIKADWSKLAEKFNKRCCEK